MRQDELMMMLLGLGDELVAEADFTRHIDDLHRVHMGAYFAEILASRKYKGLGTTKEERIEPVGSLITPILKFYRIALPVELIDRKQGRRYLDDTYLANARIYRDKVYQWTVAGGAQRYCELPKTHWAVLESWEQVRFELPEDEQCNSEGYPLIDPQPQPQKHDELKSFLEFHLNFSRSLTRSLLQVHSNALVVKFGIDPQRGTEYKCVIKF